MAQAPGHAAQKRTQPAAAGSTRSGLWPPTATATGWTVEALSERLEPRRRSSTLSRAQQAIRRARAIADNTRHTQNGGDLSIDRQRRAIV